MARKKEAKPLAGDKPRASKTGVRLKNASAPRETPRAYLDNGTRRRRPGFVIQKPGVCGGAPIIAGTRIPIWGLEAARRRGIADKTILKMYPALTSAKLRAAWQYIAEHQELIDAQIVVRCFRRAATERLPKPAGHRSPGAITKIEESSLDLRGPAGGRDICLFEAFENGSKFADTKAQFPRLAPIRAFTPQMHGDVLFINVLHCAPGGMRSHFPIAEAIL
jgi:uncharacterized protein (DUF433 family)